MRNVAKIKLFFNIQFSVSRRLVLSTEDGICGRGFMIYTWGNSSCAIEFRGLIANLLLLFCCGAQQRIW